MEYRTSETTEINKILTDTLIGKTVSHVTKVNCDEGFTIHFTDGTKLEAVWSSCYGDAGINGERIECSGLY